MKRKDQVRTLVSLKVGVRIENENVYVDPALLFSRLLVLVEREENMMKYFSYELTPIPTSLFENGMMTKASKSNLAKAVTKDVSISLPSEPPVCSRRWCITAQSKVVTKLQLHRHPQSI